MIGTAVSTESLDERIERLRQMDRFIKTPCRYFPYGREPAFSKLSREQCRFYAYFRTQVDTFENIKGDDGYNRLLVIECLSTEEGRARLERYLSEDRRSDFYAFAKDLLPELRMNRGADPGESLGLLWDNADLLFTEIFLPEYTGASDEQLSSILSILGIGYLRRVSSDTGVRLFGKALTLVDRYYKRHSGMSIGKTYACGRVCSFCRAFGRYLPREECTGHAVCYQEFDGRMKILLGEITDCVDAYLCIRHGGRGISESGYRMLSDELVQMISDMDGGQAEMPVEHESPIDILTADPDGRMPGGCPPPQYSKVYSGELVPKDIGTSGTVAMLPDHDISGNDGAYYPEPLVRHPDGSIGGLGYYRFWRDSLHEGRVYPADTGMILTLYSEMVRNGVPDADMYREVVKTVRPMRRIPDALTGLVAYMTIKGDLPVERMLAKASRSMFKHLIFRIMSGRKQPVAKWLLTDGLGLEIEFGSSRTWDVFRVAFIMVLRTLYVSGRDWFEDNNVSIVKLPCDYVPEGGAPLEFEALSYIRHSFVTDTGELYAEVKARLRNNRRRSFFLFGMDVSPVIDSAVGAVDRKEAARNEPPVIDMTKVRQARQDLDYVVGAVGSEEPEAEQEQDGPLLVQENDPWGALIGSLGASEREYLKAALHGTRTDSRLESSINDRAAEIMGDALVEGGRIYEEYVSEIEGRIGGS